MKTLLLAFLAYMAFTATPESFDRRKPGFNAISAITLVLCTCVATYTLAATLNLLLA